MRTGDGSPRSDEVHPLSQPIYVTVPESSRDGIDLIEIWVAVWRGKWLVVPVTIFFAIASVVYSLSVTPIYRAEVVLAPVSHRQAGSGLGELGGLASLAGIALRPDGDSRHALAILESKSFIAEFVQERNLLPVLFPEEWDAQNEQWITDDPELQRDIRDGVRVFIEDVQSVADDPATGLVTLAVEWKDPEIAATWANELVSRINERTRSRDIEESQRKLDYLNQQLNQASLVELRLAISRVIEEQISAMMLAQSQVEYAFEVIDPAIEPKKRIRPKRTMIVIVGTLMGGFVGVFAVLLNFLAKRMSERASAQQAH